MIKSHDQKRQHQKPHHQTQREAAASKDEIKSGTTKSGIAESQADNQKP